MFYPDTLTINEALKDYFEKNDFGEDGGLSKQWVKVKLGSKFYVYIPNSDARRKALVFHDIHHLATGYSTDWKGEVAIGAWEISSNCGDYYAAWLLDMWIFAVGFFFFPKYAYQGFLRGRKTKNLYHYTFTREQVLPMTIGELKAHLLLDKSIEYKATFNDNLSYSYWGIISFLSGMPVMIPVFLFLWWVSKHLI